MTIGLTYKELSAVRPCRDDKKRVAALFGGAKKWGRRSISAMEAREAGATFEDLIWVSSKMASRNPEIVRRLRLCMDDCAAHVLHIYEERGNSDAPRGAIIASRKFSRGEIDAADRAAAGRAARDAARDAGDAARHAAWASWAAAMDNGESVRNAARDAAGDATWDTEYAWQFDRLIARLSDPEPEDWPLPEVKKALAAYNDAAKDDEP